MQIGSAVTRITPEKGLYLGGSVAGAPQGNSFDGELEVNAIVIGNDYGSPRMALVSLDLLYTGSYVVSGVRHALPAFSYSSILFVASHTHQAPMVDPSKPFLGKFNKDYADWLIIQIVRVIEDAILEIAHAEISIGFNRADHSVNRRLRVLAQVGRHPKFNTVAIAPNPSGPNDESVFAIKIVGSDGRVVALIWGYACHPVSYPQKNVISAHFPGVVRQRIREEFGDDSIPVLYLQGFSGNIRPKWDDGGTWFSRLAIRLTGRGASAPMSPGRYLEWAESLAGVVVNIAGETRAIESHRVYLYHERIPTEELFEGPVEEFEASALVLGDVIMAMANGEMMAEWAARLRGDVNYPQLITVGCLNDCLGYIPTTTMLREGGYEGRDFMPYFGVRKIANCAPEVFYGAIYKVASKAVSSLRRNIRE